jgi:capsular polysaccharide transport system permease protein
MARAILAIASDYTNNLSQAVHHDTVRTSETELKKAEDAARDARLALTEFRARTGTIDPLTSAASTSAGVAAMQEEILQTRAEMTQMLAINTPNSPQVRQLQARINGLQGQIDAERKRVANVQADGSIDKNLRDYEALQISADYAERQLVGARTASDAAQSLASQRERFIVQVLPPDLPQTATEPRRLTTFLEALFVLVAVYGVVALTIAGVRDHQGI